MSSAVIQIIVLILLIAIPILIIRSGKKKAEDRERIADALEKIAESEKDK